VKKLLAFLVVVPSLVTPVVALAATQGATPKCTSGALNLVVVNQLDSNACFSQTLKGRNTFCIVGASADWSHDSKENCEDLDTLYKNENASLSFEKLPKSASLAFKGYIYQDGSSQVRDLKFTYRNGTISNNCNEVLPANMRCIVTQVSDSEHKTYILTISK